MVDGHRVVFITVPRPDGSPNLLATARKEKTSSECHGRYQMNIAWAMLALLWLAIISFVIWVIATAVARSVRTLFPVKEYATQRAATGRSMPARRRSAVHSAKARRVADRPVSRCLLVVVDLEGCNPGAYGFICAVHCQ